MALGKKTGGRKPGTPNQSTLDLQNILDREKCDPRVTMAKIINNTLTCGVCRGKKRTPYILPTVPMLECPNCRHKAKDAGNRFTMCPNCTYEKESRIAMRKCMSCKGTMMDNCSPGLRFQAAAEVLNYLLPKRKAIEHSGPEGGEIPMPKRIVVEYVGAPQNPTSNAVEQS